MASKKILIAEDDPDILELLTIVLEDSGYDVEICTSGKDVLATARRIRPQLILVDLWIPGLGGEEVTKTLKLDLDTSKIPVILVSAQHDLQAVAQRIGADAYLMKPFDLDHLLVLVQKFSEN